MTTESIIQGCRDGNAEARRELYNRYGAAMFALVRRYVKVRAAAEDVFHDGFVLVYTKIGDYRSEGSFEGWLRRIFVNAALNYLRKEQATRTLEDDVSDLPPGVVSGAPPEAMARMSDKELQRLIECLPEGYRVVLNLHAIEGYSHAEIAEMLSIGESTSRSQYLRAKQRLAELIEEAYGGDYAKERQRGRW